MEDSIKEKSTVFFSYAPLFLFVLLLCTTAFVWSVVWQEERVHTLQVSFLDVGQGDAFFIEAPHGARVLIDAGPNGVVLRRLGEKIPFWDRRLDVFLATHPDLDHIGGFPVVAKRYHATLALTSSVEDGGADNVAFREALSKHSLTPYFVRAGERVVLEEGVVLTVLFPLGDMTHADTNTASLAVRLTYGNTAFLFMGDAPQSVEHFLVERYGASLMSAVLKLGHHGAKTASSAEFLDTVRPQVAVVSAGCNNSYGHPSSEVLARLTERKVRVVQTCTSGTVVFESDGENVREYAH